MNYVIYLYLYLYNRYVIKHTYLRALGACRLALRFRKELDDTFVQLFSELSEQVELITPRLAALEARGRVLRDGIEEERKARIRHYTEILVPVKVGIALRIIDRSYIL